MDWFDEFINDMCVIEKDAIQKSGEFYEAYRVFARLNGKYTRSTTDFYNTLHDKGFGWKRKKTGRYVCGVRLK